MVGFGSLVRNYVPPEPQAGQEVAEQEGEA
jgi:hypothetical protein